MLRQATRRKAQRYGCMSTKKNRFVVVSLRIGRFALPILLPLRCAHEIIEGFGDFTSLFKRISKKPHMGIHAAEAALLAVKEHGPLDLIDIDVTSPDARVKIKILMR